MIPDLKENVESFKDFYDVLDETGGWDNFISNNKIADENFKEFLGQIGNAKFDMADYQQWLVKNGKSTLDFSDLTQKAGNVLKSFGAAISSMAINWVIGEVIGLVVKGISELSQISDTVANNAKELGSSFKSTSSDIDSYKERISELHDTINDSSSSISDVTEARKNLMSIQDELIDKYGAEGDVINSITEAINGQSEALDKLSEKQWIETKNKFNDGGFINDFANWRDGYKDNLDRMVGEMENVQTSVNGLLADFGQNAELIDALESAGYRYSASANGAVLLSGSLQNVYDDILNIQKIASDYDAPDEFLKNLTNRANDIKSTLDNYQDIWDTYILQDRILENNQLADSWHDVNEAYSEYKKSFESGDETAVTESTNAFAETLSSVLNDSNVDQAVKDYFRNMYPALQQEVSEWQFKTNFEPNTDGLKDSVESALSGLNGMSTESLVDFNASTATESQIQAYQSLKKVANEYEMEIEQLIDLLQEMGLVQSDSYNQLVEKFGQENVSKLTPEELEIAYSIENVGNMTFDELQAEVQRIKDTPVALTFDITTYKDTISDVQSSISTLRSALDSLNSGDLSKIEVVDLMQQFPDLVPYIDLTADGFGNLSAGLSELIAQQPTALIQSLEELKGSLTTEEERVQVDLLIDSLQRLSSYGDTGMEAYATTIGATWSDTANVIEGVTTQFENLAKVQEAVSNGLTISATAAAELAKMYPEILTNAEFSANGQLTLNEAVVKSILEGDNSIISAQIAKLEADKAELTSKKTFAEAQLNIARQIGEGEGKISEEVARYRLDIANQLAEKLIEAGMEEDKAYAAVAESMAGNMDEYNRIVSEVAEDTSKNIDAAAVSMAESININSINAQTSFENLRNKVCDLAEAIKNAAQGKQGGNAGIYGGGGSTSKGGISASTHSGSFNTTYTEYTAQIADFDSFQSQLELDIKGYTDAISNIDSQIEVLKNLQQTFDSNDGIGGHSYSDKIKQLEKEKESLNNAAKDSAKSTSDSNKETAESFNWIEKAVSRVQRTIKNLGDTVSSTWRNWKDRNDALASQLNEVRKEISLQQSAYESYMRAAESVGLSDHYKNLIQNGALSIEDIADDTLKEQIKSYQEWYEKALDCSDAIQELNSQLAELAKTKFDNVSARYDAGIQDVDFVISLINTELDKTDALNQIAGESFYNALIDKEKERIDILTSEYDELCQVFNESVATGMIAEGSEAWQGMKSGIDSVAESIREAEVQILKYENSIKEIAKLKFDDLQKQFDNVTNVITSNISKIEKEISLVEESGAIAGETFYQALIESGRTNLEALEQKHRSLSDSLKEALDNGSVEEYDDTWFEMTDSISSVEEAILDARLALIKYEESMKQVAKIKFDDLAKQFDNVTSAISGNQSIIEKQIAYMEATGKVAGKAFYEGLISSEEEKLSTLEQQFASLSQALQEALDSGSVVEGDDTFYEMTGQLTDLEGKIWDSRTALVEFNKELDNVAKIRFDTVGDAFSQVTGLISSDISIIEKQIALVEDSGRIAGESFYRALIESANQSAEIAEQKYNAMAAELQKGLDDGSITMYDDNWYEMSTELNNIKLEWLDAQDAVVKYQNSLKEVASIKFDSIESQFDNAISLITHGISRIEKEIDAVEQSGMIAGESYYKELQKLQDKNIDTLKKKYDELTSILNEALDNGSVTEYSEEWYEMVTAINSVEDAIYDAESAAAKYGEQIKEIAKLKFDSLNSQFSNAINLVTSDMGLIEKQMALIEASGKEVGESFYRELIDAGNTKIDALKKQYDELYKAMEGVEKYSDNWYEMADTLYKIRGEIIDTETAVVRYGNSLKEVSMIKFDNISEQFDTALSLISYQIDEIELKMQIAQESGYIAGESFYKALISAETKNLEVLEKEYDALLSALNEALANGSIEKWDENYISSVQKIAAVRKAILNSQLAQAKYQSSLNNSTSGGTNTTRDIAKETFDSLEKQFSGAIGIITSAIDQLEKKMSFVEEAGYVAGESFYNALIEAEKTHIESLVKEYETLTSSLNNVEKYSDNWYDMVGSINSVKDALIDAETALVKYGNALKELEWDMFDRAQESVSRLSGESDFITELMGTNRETRNEDGTLNDRGLAVQGLHAVNYDVYMRQAQEYGEAIKKLNKEIAEDPGNTKLLDRYNELMELQRDAILNAEDEKTALKDLASEGYDSLLSRLDELTGARKDALKAASDLHDYEKTVSEQSAEVTRLQKLILNYSGNDSEEMRATIQKTQEALTKAQEELSETEYDRYIADQESMLDTFSDSMKEWVNTRLDDINGLLQNAINATNNSAQAIRDQISTDLSSVGMSMTDNFSKIFELDYSGGLMDIVSEYYGGGFENGLTTVNTAIDNVILETDMVKASTDMVSEILNQRFPELAASIPTLDTTNDRIGNVSEAVVKTKDAMDNVHARIGELDTDTLKPKFDYVGGGIEGFDEDFNNLMKNLDGDLEQYDKNSGENLGSVEEAMKGVDAKVSETGSIANKLGDINTAVNNVKTPVEELKTPLDNVKTATEGTKETVDRIKTKLEDDSQDSIMGKIGSVTSAVGIAKTEVTSLNTLTQMNLGKVKDEITTVKNVLERIDTTVANLTLDRPGYGNSNSTPDYTVQNISEYGNSNNSTQSSGNSGNDQYQFIDKEDSYNKSQLNTSTSIVDLLKSNNYDPSLSARKKYYEDLGGSGEFIGSDAQNKWLMEKMHLMGYKNGVHNLREDEIAITQEDGTEAILSPYYGGVLTPLHKGDSVLTAEQTENLFRVSNIDADELRERIFGNTMPKHDVSKLMPERSNVNTNNSVSNNDIDVSFNIPNVRDSDEMAKFLKSDRAERIITSIMDTYALGKNKYRKLRY